MATETVQFTLGENNPQKLTTWAKEPAVQNVKADFEAAKPSRDATIRKIDHWNRLRDARPKPSPNNGMKRESIKARSKVQPKLIRRQAEWRYSALSEPFHSAPDMYNITPATYEDDLAARQNGIVLNWQWRTKINRIKFIDDYVRSNVDDGTVIVRIGWARTKVMVDAEAPEYSYYPIDNDQDMHALQQATAEKTANPQAFAQAHHELQESVNYSQENGTAVHARQTGTQKIKVPKLLENRPTVEVLNPANFYPDPSCNGDFEKALFAVYSFETNQAELKKDKRYKNLDLVNWEGNTVLSQPDHESTTPNDFNFKDAARKKVVAYEWWGQWDIHGDGVLVPVVCTWIGDVMIRCELNPFPDQKLPFIVVPYLPVKREMMGEPDAELLEDNQAILGALMRGMIDLLGKSANGQQGMAKGMLDPLNKRRFDAGMDYEFNPNMNPTQGLIEHKYPELPQSAMAMTQMMNQEAEALTGVKSFSGGVSGSAYGDVAAGIKGVLDAAGKRESAILRRLAYGMVKIGEKICSMNEVFLSETETIAVTKDQFVQVNREDLIGDYNLEVDIATAEVDNTKAQDMGFMLQTIGPNAPPGVTMMIMANIADLKRMPALAHQLRTYQPQPDPLEEKKKQLEIALLQAQIDELGAKTQMHQANAKRAGSDADLKDLNFVEQESGTSHARQLDLQNNKGSHDKNLQVTKALTAPQKEGQTAGPVQQALGFNVASDKLQDNLTVPPTGGGVPSPQPTLQ